MKIYIDGLERSGNNFLAGAIGYSFVIQAIPLWSHKLEALENRDKQYPFIVPVRDALPSLVSGKLYKDYAIMSGLSKPGINGYTTQEETIQRYKDYTQYVIDHEDLFVAPFHDFTKDHDSVIDVIGKTYGLKQVYKLSSEKIISKLDGKFFQEQDMPYIGNFPRDPVPEKEEIQEMLMSEYKEDIEHIQANIEILYKRYYDRRDNVNIR